MDVLLHLMLHWSQLRYRDGVPAGINLAEAALQVAAEDDAIVSHSTVQLPVHSFLQRITRLASSVNSAVIQKMPEGAAPDGVLQA